MEACFAYDIKQLYSVMFCVVRAVHKFDHKLVINETADKWRPDERRQFNEGH